MTGKRGQITVFIIIGIVLVVSFALITTYSSLEKDVPEVSAVDADSMQEYVESCLSSELDYSLILLGMQGGMLNVKEPYYDAEYSRIPYWLYDEDELKFFIVSKENAEADLERYLEDNIKECFQNIDVSGLDIDYSKKQADIDILEDSVVAEMFLPIEVNKGSAAISLDRFRVTQDVRLGKILDSARNFTFVTNDFPEGIDLTELYSYGFNTTVYDIDYDNKIISFKDTKSTTSLGEYMFNFAVELPPEYENNAPFFSVDEIRLKKDEHKDISEYIYDEEGDFLSYETISDIFEIDDNNSLYLFDDVKEGRYDLTLKIEDSEGAVSFEDLVVEVYA